MKRGFSRSAGTPVFVLGVGPTALGVLRSLGRAGLQPYLVCPRGDMASRSRWARRRVVLVDGAPSLPQLQLLTERLEFDRAVLIPCTDLWSQIVSHLPNEPWNCYSMSVPAQEVIEQLIDKLRFAEALERLDIPRPRSREVKDRDDLLRQFEEGYFLKPRHSQLFAERYHRKAFVVRNAEEAVQAFELIEGVGLTAILQEFIPGPASAHYFIDGFIDRRGSVAAIFARRRIRMFPLDFGNSTLMASVALDELQSAVQDLTRLLGGIGFCGIFSAEFKLDARDGIFKLIEVNSRPWWYIGFARDCGVDVSLLAYRDALSLELPLPTAYPIGKRCVFLPLDFQAFRILRQTEGLSLADWLRSWFGAQTTIFKWRDPLPAISLPLQILRKRRSRPARRA